MWKKEKTEQREEGENSNFSQRLSLAPYRPFEQTDRCCSTFPARASVRLMLMDVGDFVEVLNETSREELLGQSRVHSKRNSICQFRGHQS